MRFLWASSKKASYKACKRPEIWVSGDGERLVDCDAFYGRLRRNVKSMPGMGRMGRMLSWPGEP